MIVLHRGGKDFRSRGTGAINQHREWSAVGNARLRVVEYFDAAIGVFQLHHWAVIDEQATERGGFRQIAAAVTAQIEHQRIHGALRLQLADQAANVASGSAIVGITGAASVVVLVKTRHRNDAYA